MLSQSLLFIAQKEKFRKINGKAKLVDGKVFRLIVREL
jgi:hypothetical protein